MLLEMLSNLDNIGIPNSRMRSGKRGNRRSRRRR
jgi:hypothetical protein